MLICFHNNRLHRHDPLAEGHTRRGRRGLVHRRPEVPSCLRIRVKQERRQLTVYGTSLQAEEYLDPPAHYFGVPAVGARDGDTLRDALAAALQADGPTVIEAVVDADHYSDTVFD